MDSGRYTDDGRYIPPKQQPGESRIRSNKHAACTPDGIEEMEQAHEIRTN